MPHTPKGERRYQATKDRTNGENNLISRENNVFSLRLKAKRCHVKVEK